MPRRTRVILAVLTAVALILLGIGLYGIRTQREAASAGFDTAAVRSAEESLVPAFAPGPAPAISGRTLDGDTLDLASLRGRPVLLNVWASWCGPCRKEIPAIAAWAKAHPEVTVVGVDYQDDVDAARAFAREHGATWPSIVDDGPIGEALQVPGLPATYLIDADGRLVDRILGEVTEPLLDARLKAAGA